MKNFVYYLLFLLFLLGCSSDRQKSKKEFHNFNGRYCASIKHDKHGEVWTSFVTIQVEKDKVVKIYYPEFELELTEGNSDKLKSDGSCQVNSFSTGMIRTVKIIGRDCNETLNTLKQNNTLNSSPNYIQNGFPQCLICGSESNGIDEYCDNCIEEYLTCPICGEEKEEEEEFCWDCQNN